MGTDFGGIAGDNASYALIMYGALPYSQISSDNLSVLYDTMEEDTMQCLLIRLMQLM